ncbi:hypothetical protein PCANC_08364 [Puccinia coronata f. sp. avenae]|uniref:Uncharacterized protein n=1 Tax=Puccinia coronata f. sp. avenae TaxID=200324 RepID=A0A2N5V6I3_9BASI|nr:hypothetical protein PCANC_08364 [Puccinia coronata f. sp. avenae]
MSRDTLLAKTSWSAGIPCLPRHLASSDHDAKSIKLTQQDHSIINHHSSQQDHFDPLRKTQNILSINPIHTRSHVYTRGKTQDKSTSNLSLSPMIAQKTFAAGSTTVKDQRDNIYSSTNQSSLLYRIT